MGIIIRKRSPKEKAFNFFTTLADFGSLFVTLVYISYVGMLMILGLGFEWLNWTMFGITIAYIGFFFFKIFYLNQAVSKTARVKRIAKLSYKYTKLGMRLINATFVVLSLISVQLGENHTTAIVGIMVVGITFVVSVLWDIGSFILRRKVAELMVMWNSLTPDEKSERIELFMAGFIRSLDNVAILDDYLAVGVNVKKLVDDRLSERIKLADARRIDPYGETITDEE